jgi:hypothetical protein
MCPQPKADSNWTTVSITNEVELLDRKPQDKLNLSKKASTGVTELLHVTAIQSYWKIKVKTISRLPILKPPALCVSDVSTILPLIQLLEQIEKLQYEIKALAGNQVKIQPNTSDSNRIITKALAEKRKAFHIFKPKQE